MRFWVLPLLFYVTFAKEIKFDDKDLYLVEDECFPGYYPTNRAMACFKLHTEPKIWKNAVETCQKEGTNLAMVYSRPESIFFGTRLLNDQPFQSAFLGAKRWPRDDWRDIYGYSVNHEVQVGWAPGEPKVLGDNEGCLAIDRDGNFIATLCNKPNAFFCIQVLTSQDNIDIESLVD